MRTEIQGLIDTGTADTTGTGRKIVFYAGQCKDSDLDRLQGSLSDPHISWKESERLVGRST